MRAFSHLKDVRSDLNVALRAFTAQETVQNGPVALNDG